MTVMSGAEAFAAGLVKMGTRFVYGEIGTSVLGFFDGLYGAKETIHYISCRHEQVAASMADVEGRLTGRPGVAIVHSGPGALNALISVGNALKDSSPMFLVTGAVKSRLAGTDGMLEAAHLEIFKSLTKGAFRLSSVSEVPGLLSKAYSIAVSGAPGPVLIEVPEDVWKERGEVDEAGFVFAPEPLTAPADVDIQIIAEGLAKAKQPLILAGAGAKKFAAHLVSFAERLGIPVATTGNGRGVIKEDHALALGRVGFGGGSLVADKAFLTADMILCLGCGISDMVTYEYTQIPDADIYMINQDPAASGKPVFVTTHILADVGLSLMALEKSSASLVKKTDWLPALGEIRSLWSAALTHSASHFGPSAVFAKLDTLLSPGTIVSGGAGLHVVYANDYLKARSPNSFLAAVNFGAMGFGLPAAMAAAIHKPGVPIIAVLGDGETMTTIQDLETLVREKLPVKIFIVNDNAYRVLEIKQRMNYQGRVIGTKHDNPDFLKLAEAFGMKGWRLSAANWEKELMAAVEYKGPCLIEIPCDQDDLPPTNVEAALAMGQS